MDAAGGQVKIEFGVVVGATVVNEVVVGRAVLVVGGVLGVAVVEVVVGGGLVVVVDETVVIVEGRLVVDVALVDVVDVTVVDDEVVVGLQLVKPNGLRLLKVVPFEHLPPMT